MKTDFELWLSAQYAETGSFTAFILLMRRAGDEVVPLTSSYAHLVGDDMPWRQMRALLDGARTAWGGPLPDAVAARRLKDVEADVKRDPLVLNRGRFFDRAGRHIRIDEVEP